MPPFSSCLQLYTSKLIQKTSKTSFLPRFPATCPFSVDQPAQLFLDIPGQPNLNPSIAWGTQDIYFRTLIQYTSAHRRSVDFCVRTLLVPSSTTPQPSAADPHSDLQYPPLCCHSGFIAYCGFILSSRSSARATNASADPTSPYPASTDPVYLSDPTPDRHNGRL